MKRAPADNFPPGARHPPPANLPEPSPARGRGAAGPSDAQLSLAAVVGGRTPPAPKKLPVLVSACLVGCVCRWHGRKTSPAAGVRRYFEEHPEAEPVPVCPEMLGGLPTPRPAVKRVKGRVYETADNREERPFVTGRDVTAEFQAGAAATVAIAKDRGAKLALLARFSPSCDKTGIAGRALIAAGVEVENF